jgi:hypothetical protein
MLKMRRFCSMRHTCVSQILANTAADDALAAITRAVMSEPLG